MKIGLLVCDQVNSALRDKVEDYPHMFQALFADAFVWRHYDVVAGDYPDTLDECDGYMTTGSICSVYENKEWIVKLKNFIYTLYKKKKKYVGICFGHQMIAHALGGVVEKSPRGWGLGVKTDTVFKKHPWLPCDAYNIIFSHQDQIVKMPPGAEILAGNSHCPISMIKIDDFFLGLQGHPEFTPTYAELLLTLRKKQIPLAVYQAAIQSFAITPDIKLLKNIIIDFYSQ